MLLKNILFVLTAALAAPALLQAEPAAGGRETAVIRLAVISYGDPQIEQLYSREPWLREITRQLEAIAPVEIAQGSYGEVVSWIENGRTDLAVLTPGAAAAVLNSNKASGIRYAASERHPQSSHSVCVTAAGSKVSKLNDLKGRDDVEYIFVDPLSVSGRILPQYLFQNNGIYPAEEKIRYSASHLNSLRTLDRQESGIERIACVWEDLLHSEPDSAARYRVLAVPQIEQIELPGNLLFAAAESRNPRLERLRFEQNEAVTVDSNWRSQIERVSIWLKATAGPGSLDAPGGLSLQDFGLLLVNYLNSRRAAPRLAVVLSGGGAKCSFQVGALRAIEEELEGLRRKYKAPELDIGLVVGTSGGAINAVAAAMGATRSDAGYRSFADLWQQLDQRKIIRPSLLVRLNMGLWFYACQMLLLLVLSAVSPKFKRRLNRRQAAIFGLFGLLQLLPAWIALPPSALFGSSADGQRFFLWAGWGMNGAGWLQMLTAGICLLRNNPARRIASQRGSAIALLLLVIGLPVVQAGTIFWKEQTLSGNSGIKELAAESYPRLINAIAASENRPPLEEIGIGDLDQQIRSLSIASIKAKSVVRDLVLTVSRLPQAGQTLPADLYFYLTAGSGGPPPQFGDRGFSLLKYPELLFDVMIGSGAIYPVFPPRELRDFPQPGESIEVVDGSFSHRSPIEAAVLWGATHVIILEASPEEFVPRGSFAANIGAALAHLYDQAQLLDQYSKTRVTTVTLYPRPPHIGLLDFSANFISGSIEAGYRQARGESGPGRKPFRERPGEPLFVTAASPVDGNLRVR